MNLPDHIARAYELLRLERYNLALEEVQRALEQDPRSAEAHVCGAWILFDQRQLNRAEESARLAVAAEPTMAAAHHALAIVLLAKGRRHEASAVFKSMTTCPDFHDAPYLLSYAHFLTNKLRFQEALTVVERALTLAPTWSAVHEVQGTILQELGRVDEAREAYLRALQLDPHNIAAHQKMGEIELICGDADVALAHFREVLRQNPNKWSARNDLILALGEARYPLVGRSSAGTRRFYSFLSYALFNNRIVLGATILLSIAPFVAGFAMLAWDISFGLILIETGAWIWKMLILLLAIPFVWMLFATLLMGALLFCDPSTRRALEFAFADGVGIVIAVITLIGLVITIVGLLLLGLNHPATRLGIGVVVSSIAGICFAVGLRGIHRDWVRAAGAAYIAKMIGIYGIAAAIALDIFYRPVILALAILYFLGQISYIAVVAKAQQLGPDS